MDGTVTIRGRCLTAADVEFVREVVARCWKQGRSHISRELCREWGWFQANGNLKDMACRELLLRLELMGEVALPPRRCTRKPGDNKVQSAGPLELSFAPRPIEGKLIELRPVEVRMVRGTRESGYAWVFCCATVSLFLFRHTRSGEVPREVLCTEPVPGVLGVDRYSGYSRVSCKVQYCYEHLKRNLQDIVKQFPDEPEVKRFAKDVIEMLKQAMTLRRRRISDKRFYQRAAELKRKIKAAMEADANHEAIRTYQEIFRENEDKMYHWADDRRVPAENNRAERELRPIVIARKISFGSQSPKGRNTREVLASVLNTLRQRGRDPAVALKAALDQLAEEPDLEPYPLLFGESIPVDRTNPTPQPRRPTPPAKDSVGKADPLPPLAPPSASNLAAISQHVLVAVILFVTLLAAAEHSEPPVPRPTRPLSPNGHC